MDTIQCALIFGAGILAALVLLGIALAGWVHNASLKILEESEYEGQHRSTTNASGKAVARNPENGYSSIASPIATITSHSGNRGH